MSPYIRTVTTASGATAVQIILSEYSGKRTMQHIGSAHDEHELELSQVLFRLSRWENLVHAKEV